VVSPLANAGAPLITAVVSMLVLGAMPNSITLAGIALAFMAATLLAVEPEEKVCASPA
jgi:drug/metabolite transporter (DMT)-like permease